jgi:hypothetical protein
VCASSCPIQLWYAARALVVSMAVSRRIEKSPEQRLFAINNYQSIRLSAVTVTCHCHWSPGRTHHSRTNHCLLSRECNVYMLNANAGHHFSCSYTVCNNGVLGFLRNAISGPEIGTMVALKTPHDVQKIFLAVWRGKV